VKHGAAETDHAFETLLARGRVVPRAPDLARARGLARARATVAAVASAAALPMPVMRVRGLHIAVAAILALMLGTAGALAAFRARARRLPPPSWLEPPAALAPAAIADPPAPTAGPARRARSKPVARDAYAMELDVLQRAQAAYVGRDLGGALALLAEHARRFPNGQLTEEREALRVQSLARSAHVAEAREVAAAFAGKFPRSVLLPQVLEWCRATE
jgi:hypothetical protein